jgi:saccharopine dehydrogenase-like NADP-dependent oxidoreductase
MTRALVLGGGMVGSAMVMDLAEHDEFEVTVADLRPEALQRLRQSHGVKIEQADLSDPAEVRRLAGSYDIVLGALASKIGLQTLKAVIEAGTNYVDISFMGEDATVLSSLAEKAGVTAVVDCGVAPGMSNMAAGFAAAQLDPCERIEIYVGGLPVERTWPFQYKAGFAPADVLEEYTRPSRVVENGRQVVVPALSGIELLDFEGIGTLEAFVTDGLRTLVRLGVPTMIEKTMRYPGHAELMRAFRETGLFSAEPIEIGGQKVIPLEVTSALLFPKWTFEPGEEDLTVMRLVATGRKAGQRQRMTWNLLDHYDPETATRSMSRTTAFPATIVARTIVSGRFVRPGVHAPEVLGRCEGMLEHVLSELEVRGVHYDLKVEDAIS